MTNYKYIDDVTIGTDPELFIFNTKTQTVVSSIGLIPGFKKNAYVPEGFAEGYGLQIDNILAEFNVPPVSLVRKESQAPLFVEQINKMKEYIREFVKNINPNYDILCSPAEFVPEDQLLSDEAKQFGCSPDYNVYTLQMNEPPEGAKGNLRSTGVHCHLGYDDPDLATSIGLLKVLDLYLGVPSILIDKDTKRRTLYGKAGCFRLTDYGVEYRVLSGYFIKDDTTITWVYNQVVKAINYYNHLIGEANDNDVESFDINKYLPSKETIFNAINNSSTISAKRIVNKYNINLID